MRILFIGESWTIHMIHTKGYDSIESTKYEEGATFLLDCLREEGVEVDYMPAHEVQVRFPTKIEELEKYDAIVLSDIGSNTFLLQNKTVYEREPLPNSLKLIEEFVQEGGGFLMIGGYLSFMGIEGKANYKKTAIANILPIEMLDGDDRVEMPQGVNPETVGEHSITNGIDTWPYFLGYNRFMAKKDAEVLATINGDPFIVIGANGKGKTACFASDCAPHWASKEFLAWDRYPRFWSEILRHISRKS